MSRVMIVVLAGISVLALAITLGLNVAPVERDLVDELVQASLILEVPADAITQPSATGDVPIDIDVLVGDRTFLIYNVPTEGVPIAFVDEVDLGGDRLLGYREIASQRSLANIAETASSIVLVAELRAFRPDSAPPYRLQAIALDANGDAIASDWRDDSLDAQIALLGAALEAEGVSWVDGIAALIDAGRDIELDREIENALGLRLIEATAGSSN